MLIPCLALLALSCVGIAISNGNYGIYAISLFVIRLMIIPLQMGGFMLCANWFIKYRGRALGIITAGSPLFSTIGIASLNAAVSNGGLKFAYLIIATIVFGLALLVTFYIKDDPESADLFPDGENRAPISESKDISENVSLKEILADSRAWMLIISFGILQFICVAMMSYMAVRYISLSTPEDIPNLFVSKVLIWLSVGAAAGIPMSFVLGWIDDKLGSVKAALILIVLYFFAVVPLAIMPVGGSVPLMIVWAFGVACMTGGMPTLHPCITSYVYGRKKYMSANKWIMSIQAVLMSSAIAFMGFFNQMGKLTIAYYIMMGLLVIAFISVYSMRNVADANCADRDYGLNKKAA